jgi:hypothetical protein
VVEAKHLAKEAQRPHAIKVAHGDDKCKIPQGQPGEYVSVTTRDHAGGGGRGSLLPIETTAGAMDHDHYKSGSLTPSVLLMGAIPEDAGDSWYGGQVYVDLRDSVFEASEPYLHAANLVQLLRKEAEKERPEYGWGAVMPGSMPDYLWMSFDGGADRNNKHLKVKLSLIAVMFIVKLKKLSGQRGAPYQSYTLTGERPMSLLQIGLNGVSLARGKMDEPFEKMIAGCHSMGDIRYVAGVGPEPRSRASRASKVKNKAGVADGGGMGGKRKARPSVGEESGDGEEGSDGVEVEEGSDGEEDKEDSDGEEDEEGGGGKGSSEGCKEYEGDEAQTLEEMLVEDTHKELRKQWKERAVAPSIKCISERWEQLELKGNRVIMHKTVSQEMKEELHVALKQL